MRDCYVGEFTTETQRTRSGVPSRHVSRGDAPSRHVSRGSLPEADVSKEQINLFACREIPTGKKQLIASR